MRDFGGGEDSHPSIARSQATSGHKVAGDIRARPVTQPARPWYAKRSAGSGEGIQSSDLGGTLFSRTNDTNHVQLVVQQRVGLSIESMTNIEERRCGPDWPAALMLRLSSINLGSVSSATWCAD